jgi:DNA polymerase I-like protein with 3'-5' exonuclease and polymerase domains
MYDPNLQQQSRKGGVRECFVSRPGRVFCSVDFDTAELRGLSQITIDFGLSCHRMADALNAGLDPHVGVAADLLGLTYGDAAAKLKAEAAALKAGTVIQSPDTTPVTDRRQLAKVLNFGLPGGLGAKTFVGYAAGQGVEVSEVQAVDLKKRWLESWPEMKEYFARIAASMDLGTCASRVMHPRSNRVRGYVKYTAAANGYFQGLVADMAKAALWAVVRECFLEHLGSPLFGTRPSMFIHDEIIAEVPETRATEAAERMAVTMCEAAQKWLPDVKVTAAPALMRRWYKNAKEVRGPNGELLPWEPEQAGEKKAAA